MRKSKTIWLLIIVLHLAGYLQAQPPRRVRIDKQSLDKVFKDYGVSRLSVLTTQGHSYLTDPGQIEIGAILAVRLSGSPTINKSEKALEYVLPYRFGILRQTGIPPLSLAIVVLIPGGAIEYHPDQHRYLGSLLVGALDEQNPSLNQPLQGVMAHLIVDQGKVDRASVPIAATGVPYESVTMEAGAITGNEVGLQVIPSFSPDDPLDLTVPVLRPEIAILPSPKRIQGYGLQACRLTVTVSGANANEIKKLSLSATQGKLDPEVVEIDAAMRAGMTSLYSSGRGNSEVSVSSGDLSASQTVPFVFPFAFIISAILGGIVGALIKGHKPLSKFAVSILAGLVISIGIVFGINLVEINVVEIYTHRGFSEAFIFLIAALGAFGGSLVIKRKSQPPGN